MESNKSKNHIQSILPAVKEIQTNITNLGEINFDNSLKNFKMIYYHFLDNLIVK